MCVWALDQRDQTSEQKNEASALIKVVRESTDRFQNRVSSSGGRILPPIRCGHGPDSGAMGMHFVNMALVTDGILDATRPEIVILRPLPTDACA